MSNSPVGAGLLGIVEGLTEFLPISSTGHLIVAQTVIGFKDPTETFSVVIQTGAICSVIWYYRHDLLRQFRELPENRETQRLVLSVLIAFLPAVVFGFLFGDWITGHLFSPTVVALSLIVGGIAIWIVESIGFKPRIHRLEETRVRQAIAIGFLQCLALVPGVSRSAASIFGGMFAGLDRKTATQFSFYLGMPTLVGAGLYKLVKDWHAVVDLGVLNLGIGLVVSFASGLLAVGWLLKFVAQNNFIGFAIYRIVLGLSLLALVALQII